LDIRDFRLLIALAEHRHFARAAGACHISQPAFSARLRGLEHALGVRIVERGARFERFTADGERVLGWGRRIVAMADGLEQDVSAAHGALSGRLRLAAIPTQLPVAGELAALMKARHPGVQVVVSSRTSKAIDIALDHYDCDVGLTYLDAERPQNLVRLPLYEERYVAVVPFEVARFAPGPLRWRDAAGLPLALLVEEMQNRRIIDEAFRQAGVAAEAAIESDTFAALMGAVRLGHVAAILPRSHAANFGALENAGQHDLCAPDVAMAIGLVAARRDPELPLAAAFAALAKERFDASGRAGDAA
jgi:DNA-binding transcriptional LysR family regulator